MNADSAQQVIWRWKMKVVTILFAVFFVAVMTCNALADPVEDRFRAVDKWLAPHNAPTQPQQVEQLPETRQAPPETQQKQPEQSRYQEPLLATVTEEWTTIGLTSGVLTLKRTGRDVEGRYPEDNGEVIGTMTGNTLTGYWIEDASARRCSSSVKGRYYWGGLRADFEGGKAVGKWGYCEDALSADWTGKRK